MSVLETSNQPYLVASLVNQSGRRPDWLTYPVLGIHLVPATQSIYEAAFSADETPIPLADGVPVGNARHNGLLLAHDKRSKTHGPNTPQYNRQAVSVLTVREVGHIAALLGINGNDSPGVLEEFVLADEHILDSIEDVDTATGIVVAHCLGANMLLGGLADDMRLQPGYDIGGLGQGLNPKTGQPRPEFRGAVGVTGVNQPCPQPGARLAKVYGLDNPKAVGELFEEGARDNRGHVAQIIEAGVLRTGDPIFVAPYRS